MIPFAHRQRHALLKDDIVVRMMFRKRGITLILILAVFSQLPAVANESTPSVRNMIEGVLDETLAPHEIEKQFRGLDCSHLVHALYGVLGQPYQYATSRTLYTGVRPFQRVNQPAAGDLVVWRGHVGVVVDPTQHRFLSALKSGVKVSSYLSGYWQRRGHPRFFRYALSEGMNSFDDSGSTIASAASQ